MKSCVVFAVTIFDVSKLYVLREYLDVFKRDYSNCDIYIGINHGSVNEIESVIDSYQLNTFSIRNTEDLYNTSDASAYQVALKHLKASGNRYDLYWFAHTKGGVNGRDYERNLYLNELFGKRDEIELLFKTHGHIGSYGLRGVSGGAAGDEWATFNRDHVIDICTNIATDKLPYTHINWSYIETMYVLNKQSIETFFDITTDEFYNTKINDRWYFETIFPWVASRCGYFPYIRQEGCFFNNSISLKSITKSWIIENNLLYLMNYINL